MFSVFHLSAAVRTFKILTAAGKRNNTPNDFVDFLKNKFLHQYTDEIRMIKGYFFESSVNTALIVMA
jgi:hypothetical protein